MAPRGKTPSLIGSGAGSSKFVDSVGTRRCKRCKGKIEKNTRCAEVGIPGAMGHRTYCLPCYRQILAQTREDLARLEAAAAPSAV